MFYLERRPYPVLSPYIKTFWYPAIQQPPTATNAFSPTATLKPYCRIQRFQQAVQLIHRGADIHWAELALTCGYYDQSHFANDFQAFSGPSPTPMGQPHLPRLKTQTKAAEECSMMQTNADQSFPPSRPSRKNSTPEIGFSLYRSTGSNPIAA
jgi:AraC-like DNA-binding protein